MQILKQATNRRQHARFRGRFVILLRQPALILLQTSKANKIEPILVLRHPL
ncbi:Uncharacterised protein [Vibrio cholerae]|nr:Uncharacterised protein [Vibrio cholerae]CSB81545.1 Uncharacterised protein [Vibrio cholerae]